MGGDMNYLAIDLGSSSARVMLVDEKTFEASELARFSHSAFLDEKGNYRWDIINLFDNLKNATKQAINNYQVKSIGICSWGVDYGVICEDGSLLDLPYCYRDKKNQKAFEELHSHLDEFELFEKSGIYPNPINTIYQLFSDKKQNRYGGKNVKIALIADLFAFYLTGEIRAEQSNASTTGLLDLSGKDWNYPLIEDLGLDKTIFPKIIFDGEKYGDFCGVSVVAVGTHDTSSAIFALKNLDKNSAFLASGSWLLVGQVLDKPVLTKTAFQNKYTNERINFGKISLLDNINGLFVVQRVVKENNLNYKEIDQKMSSAKVLGCIDVDLLMSQDNMTQDILKQLNIKQCDMYDLVKTVYYSLAKRVAVALERLQQVTQNKIQKVIMTGGATKAKYFVATLEEVAQVKVECQQSEGATLGNALRQSLID